MIFLVYRKDTGQITNVVTASRQSFQNFPLPKEYYCSMCDKDYEDTWCLFKTDYSVVNGREFRQMSKDRKGDNIPNEVPICPKCKNIKLDEKDVYDRKEIDVQDLYNAKKHDYYKVDVKGSVKKARVILK